MSKKPNLVSMPGLMLYREKSSGNADEQLVKNGSRVAFKPTKSKKQLKDNTAGRDFKAMAEAQKSPTRQMNEVIRQAIQQMTVKSHRSGRFMNGEIGIMSTNTNSQEVHKESMNIQIKFPKTHRLYPVHQK